MRSNFAVGAIERGKETIAVKYRVKFQISTNCKKRLANFQFHEIENMSISNQRNQLQIEIEFHILQPIF